MQYDDRISRTRLWPALLAAVMTGLVLGGTNSLSNVFGSPFSTYSLRPGEGVFALQVLAPVVGTAWAWAMVAFALGWWSPTLWLGPVTGVLVLVAAAVVYYVSDHAFGLNDNLELGEMVFWMAISVPVGSVFGLLGYLARRPRWWSLLPGLAAPVLIVMFAYPAGSDRIQPWPERVAWIMAAAMIVATTSRWLLAADPTNDSGCRGLHAEKRCHCLSGHAWLTIAQDLAWLSRSSATCDGCFLIKPSSSGRRVVQPCG